MNKRLTIAGFCMVSFLSSCLISRQPQQELGDMHSSELQVYRTFRVPMLIARPVLKAQLKSDDAAAALRGYLNRVNGVSVTIARTSADFDAAAFREMTSKAPYQNWITLNAYGNTVYVNAAEKNNSIRRISIAVVAKDQAMVYARLKCNFTPDELSHFINLLMSDEQSVKGWMSEINSAGGKL